MIRKKTIKYRQKSIRAQTFGFSSGDSSSPSPSLGRATTVFTNVIQSLPPAAVKATSLHHSNKKALSRAVSEGSANNTNNSLPAATHVMVHHRSQASSHSKPPEKSR